MRIGIDLDNTLADYRRPLERLCALHGLGESQADPKLALRDHLRDAGREGEWTRLQGELYGPLMEEALLFTGAEQFLARCREQGVECHIISHRTRRPISGDDHDLHEAASLWLARFGLSGVPAYFEETKKQKLERIASLGLDVFIDDLPEILNDPGFPVHTRAILFDPGDRHARHENIRRAPTWMAVEDSVFAE